MQRVVRSIAIDVRESVGERRVKPGDVGRCETRCDAAEFGSQVGWAEKEGLFN